MRDTTQTVSSRKRKLFIIGHSPVHLFPAEATLLDRGRHAHYSKPRSRRELFPRAAIVADLALSHPSRSMVPFRKPMNCIQDLVQDWRFPQAPLLCFWTVPA